LKRNLLRRHQRPNENDNAKGPSGPDECSGERLVVAHPVLPPACAGFGSSFRTKVQ
jgi:hypothetical protein